MQSEHSRDDTRTSETAEETIAPAGPLYHRVYAALRERLDTGQWRVGDRLPTEKELVDEYAVSLITVRRALSELVREHRIERTRGRGTFVSAIPVERELTELSSFTDEMRTRGLASSTQLLSSSLAEAGPRVAEMLQLLPGAAVYSIERLRWVGETPLLLESVQIPAHLVPGLLEEDIAGRSLYDILTVRYDLDITHGQESLEPVLPTADEAARLGQGRRMPVLSLELVSFTPQGVPVEYCRSVVRGDRARYRFDVARRRPALTLVTPPAAVSHPKEHR